MSLAVPMLCYKENTSRILAFSSVRNNRTAGADDNSVEIYMIYLN